jgi:succinate dehydrogenase/fumarate reductase flavoprotein subunit
VGGGTSGVPAAIACARQGIDTLIVEQFGYLGGSQTAALVMPMMPINVRGTSSLGGINDEIRERLMATGDAGMEREQRRVVQSRDAKYVPTICAWKRASRFLSHSWRTS